MKTQLSILSRPLNCNIDLIPWYVPNSYCEGFCRKPDSSISILDKSSRLILFEFSGKTDEGFTIISTELSGESFRKIMLYLPNGIRLLIQEAYEQTIFEFSDTPPIPKKRESLFAREFESLWSPLFLKPLQEGILKERKTSQTNTPNPSGNASRIDVGELKTISLGESTSSEFNNSNLTAFLKSMSTIRIIVKNGAGFGNQAAAITAMNHLRYLGFEGIFHLLHEKGSVNERLQLLGLHHLDPHKIVKEFVTSSDFPALPFVPLAICAADDYALPPPFGETAAFKANCACYLVVQPTDWNIGYHNIHFIDEKNPISLDKTIEQGVLHTPTNYQLSKETPLQFVDRYNFPNNFPLSKINFIKVLLNLTTNSSCYYQSIYGLAYNDNFLHPRRELRVLVAAALKTQTSVFNKPLVLLVHSELEIDDCLASLYELGAGNLSFEGEERTIRRRGRVIFVPERDIREAINLVKKLHDDEIVICQIGKLPRDIMEIMFLESTLPPVAEGANTMPLLETSRSFLHGGRKSDLVEVDTNFKDAQRIHLDASASLALSPEFDLLDSVEKVAEFYEAYFSGLLDEYFSERKEIFLARTDKLATMISAIATGKELVQNSKGVRDCCLMVLNKLTDPDFRKGLEQRIKELDVRLGEEQVLEQRFRR